MIRTAVVQFRPDDPDQRPTAGELAEILTSSAQTWAQQQGGTLEEVLEIEEAVDLDTGEPVFAISFTVRTPFALL